MWMALGMMREGFARLREEGRTSWGDGAARGREQLPAAGRCQGMRRGRRGYEWNREASKPTGSPRAVSPPNTAQNDQRDGGESQESTQDPGPMKQSKGHFFPDPQTVNLLP